MHTRAQVARSLVTVCSAQYFVLLAVQLAGMLGVSALAARANLTRNTTAASLRPNRHPTDDADADAKPPGAAVEEANQDGPRDLDDVPLEGPFHHASRERSQAALPSFKPPAAVPPPPPPPAPAPPPPGPQPSPFDTPAVASGEGGGGAAGRAASAGGAVRLLVQPSSPANGAAELPVAAPAVADGAGKPGGAAGDVTLGGKAEDDDGDEEEDEEEEEDDEEEDGRLSLGDTPAALAGTLAVAGLAGIVGGMLGLGGGMLIGPLLLELGAHPQVRGGGGGGVLGRACFCRGALVGRRTRPPGVRCGTAAKAC